MAQIFISYSRKNTTAMHQLVDALVEVFGAEGIFYDTQNTSGKPWWDNILDNIAQASVFVYLISNESLASYACRAEYLEAMRQGKHIVLIDIAEKVDLAYTDPPLAFILDKLHRLQHTQSGSIIRAITEGLNRSNAVHYRQQIRDISLRDVSGHNVNIGGTQVYHITYVMDGYESIAEPAPGMATNPRRPPPPPPRSTAPVQQPPQNPEHVYEIYARAEEAAAANDMVLARRLFIQITELEPDGLGKVAKARLTEITHENDRATAYRNIKRLTDNPETIRGARAAWPAFIKRYPDYDPDRLADKLVEQTPLPVTVNATGIPRQLTDREEALADQFRQTQDKVHRLRERYQSGEMTQDVFFSSLRELMIFDDGVWWMMGVETDQWYRSQGDEWVEATPPVLLDATSVLGTNASDRRRALAAQFDHTEREVERLRALRSRGGISQDELERQLRDLSILDDDGVWWMLGIESNAWYRYVDDEWVRATRP